MAALNDMWNKDWRNAKSMAKLRKLLKVESIQTPDGSVLEKAVEELENHTCCSKVASVIPDISESTAVNSSSTLPRENQDSPYNLRLFEQHQRPRNRNLSYALRIPVRQQSSIGQSLLQNDGKHDAEKNDDDDKDVVEVDGNSSESDGDSDEPSVKESTADEDDRRSIVSKKRRKWMDEEVADLYHGMQRYGSVAMNRWATIRADTSLRYLRGRSNVDLKDKWRWIEKRPKLLQKLANQYGKL